jgi:antitoxin component YwqK of YwqJK toxin-antitoxin module
VRAVVHLHANGRAAWAYGLDEEGEWHGLEREWDESGRLFYRARFVHGLQHGWQEQWDEQGRSLVRTRFVRGTGLDLWSCGSGCWEERHMVDCLREGYERLWVGRRNVFYEQSFRAGLEHGIERRWNDLGRLARGYPRYFVSGERVPKRAYLAARKSDPSLPVDRRDHDRPGRRWPRS